MVADRFDRVCFFVAVAATQFYCSAVFAQRDLTDIPDPDPVAELAAMVVDEQASVNLFASDPEISKPIQINFDSEGKLWIASSEVYPQIRPGEIANDKIIVLRDTDGDGVSDLRTVFADGLLIPTGVVPDGPNAAYVAESTRLLYLKDTDGDGRADQRDVVLSGFGTEDTHHLIHTLRMGPDGCLYFNQSIYIHSHIETPYGTRHLDGGGIWRYRPTNGRLEVVCKGFVNPWGHVFDHVGESFATDGAYFEGINYVFPDAVFVSSPGATRVLKGMNPGSPKHCGLEILSGTHIPPQWQGDFVANDFRSHRVCRFTVKPSGSAYVSRQQPEIIRSQHVAFRPIDARMGPDGALYIADWYNPIIQHGEVDFRDERRDREHGRVWRVSFPHRPPDPWPSFENLTSQELLDSLEDPALQIRQFARQQLWQHAASEPERVWQAFQTWADQSKATRTLELQWFSEVLERPLLQDFAVDLDQVQPDARRTTLRSVWRQRVNTPEDEKQAAGVSEWIERFVLARTKDKDPRVRLEAVACAGQFDLAMRGRDGLAAAFEAVLGATHGDIDSNMDFTIWQAIRKLDAAYPNASIVASRDDWTDAHVELAFAVSAITTPAAAETAVKLIESNRQFQKNIPEDLVDAIALAGDSSQLGRSVNAVLAADPANLSIPRLRPFLNRTLRDKTIPTDIGQTLARAVSRQDGDLSAQQISTLARLAAVWKTSELEKPLTDALSHASGELRYELVEALGSFDSNAVRQTLSKLADDEDAGTRVAATRAIAARRPRAALGLIANLLKQANTSEQGTNLIIALMSRKEMPGLLAEAIEKIEMPNDVARNLLRRVRSAGGNRRLEQAIQSSGQLETAAWKLTPELKAAIVDGMATTGSAARGEQVYRREALQCIQCHAIGVAGGLVGPNLISTGGSSPPDYIVESLLDPSAKLKEGFTTLAVLTDEAEVINGIVVARNDASVRLRLADGKEVLVASDAIEQEKPGKSLMPEGLLDSLTRKELIDLATFMAALGRDPAFTVSTEPLVRTFDSLIYSREANRRLNRTSTDTAASDDPAMQWKPMTTLVDGRIVLQELDQFKQHSKTPPTSFIRFDVQMPDDGQAKIQFETDGIEAWVDSKPTPVWDLGSLTLSKGTHTIVLAIDRTIRSEPFTIRVDSM